MTPGEDDEDLDRDPPSGERVSVELRNHLPDVRDGLTRVERIVLWQLHEAQKDFPGRNVPTATLYGRVVEHVNLSEGEFMRVLQRLIGTKI